MDIGQSRIEELGPKLGDSESFLRAALDRDDDGWILRTCDAVVGAKPPGWRSGHWEYERLALVAVVVPAPQLLADLRHNGRITVGGFETRVPPLADIVNWRHQPSRVPYDQPPLRWPTYTYELHHAERGADTQLIGLMVGDDGPSFPDHQSAVRAFFYGDFSTVGTRPGLPSELARIRAVQRDAWIDSVRVSPAHLDLYVRGTAFEGTRAEVNGSTLQKSKLVGRTGRVRLPLRGGLPDDAWLYLSRGKQWLDYRALGPRLHGDRDHLALGVEFVLPDDPESRVQALLAAGEGPRLEFKRALPGSTKEEKRRMLKTVAAFANGDGGTIVFGVDADEMTQVDVDEKAERGGRDRLGDLIRGSVVPTPRFAAQLVVANGKRLMILDVHPGAFKPYGLRLDQDQHIEFYARHGANTYPADQAEIRAATLSSAPASQEGPAFPRGLWKRSVP